ncbi:MAG TPA: GHMP kinase [Chloroflexota bacterium]|nr:GHMP kinase [Chloroflexota bacterium]
MIITQTPLRLSFLGGGTDFPEYYASPANARGGACVGVAIDKYVYVVAKERFDSKIYVNYSQKEIVDSAADLKHELVREALRLTGVDALIEKTGQGIELTTLADVPSEGSGLGSSSAVTVGLLQALWTYRGEIRTAEQLAAEACRIELGVLGKPMGVQDAYWSAHGGLGQLVFEGDGGRSPLGRVSYRGLDVAPDRIADLSRRLLLFYTHRTRRATSILAGQVRNIPDRMTVLDRLRDLAHEARARLESPAADAMDRFGALLHDGWQLKTQMADGITDKAIDDLYAAALDAGALGGKLAGAGGGGFLLLYVPLHAQDAVRARLGEHVRELLFRLERDGTKVVFNVRRDSYF